MMRRYIEDAAAFEPDAIAAMGAVLSDVCSALDVLPDDAHGREVIAVRILELANRGLRDADALRDRVLREARSMQ
jgi:hypothetical protein